MKRRSRSKTLTSNKALFLPRVLKRGFRGVGSWTIALALLPCVWAAGKATGAMLPAMISESGRSWWAYVAGAAAYLVVEWWMEKPMTLYVVGHELTHALSGLMSGAKVHSFKASARGGEVRLSKSNVFIALSPYIVPLYALAVIGLYVVVKHWWSPPQLPWVFRFLLGGALAFHVSLTLSALHGHQPDLKVVGMLLSLVIIALGNILIFGFLGVSLFSRTPTLTQFASSLASETAIVWKNGFEIAKDRWAKYYGERA